MSKRCLQRENVHPTADGIGRVGVDDPAEVFRIGYGLSPGCRLAAVNHEDEDEGE